MAGQCRPLFFLFLIMAPLFLIPFWPFSKICVSTCGERWKCCDVYKRKKEKKEKEKEPVLVSVV